MGAADGKLQRWEGKLLRRYGKLARARACCCGEEEQIECPICQSGYLPPGGWKVDVAGFNDFGCTDCTELNGTFYCTEADTGCEKLDVGFARCCCLYYEFPAAVCDVTRLETWLVDMGVGNTQMWVFWKSAATVLPTCAPIYGAPEVLLAFTDSFPAYTLPPAPIDCTAITNHNVSMCMTYNIDCGRPFPPFLGYVRVSAA